MSAWLTRLVLDVGEPGVRDIALDAGRQHKYLMRLMPDELGDEPRRQAGLLYRVEDVGRTVNLLVQSRIEPKVDSLPPEGVVSAEIRSLEPLLDALNAGSVVRYRIAANPTKRWAGGAQHKSQIGKLHVLRGEQAEEWWLNRARACGLEIRNVDCRPLPDAQVGRRARHAMSRFDGSALVTDAEALREAVLNGIGRAQSYGCGLLSLAVQSGSRRAV